MKQKAREGTRANKTVFALLPVSEVLRGLECDWALCPRMCPGVEEMSALRAKAGHIEVVLWKSVQVERPDDDEAVLIFSAGSGETVWIGYRDGDVWREASAERVDGITHWARMPEGPI